MFFGYWTSFTKLTLSQTFLRRSFRGLTISRLVLELVGCPVDGLGGSHWDNLKRYALGIVEEVPSLEEILLLVERPVRLQQGWEVHVEQMVRVQMVELSDQRISELLELKRGGTRNVFR